MVARGQSISPPLPGRPGRDARHRRRKSPSWPATRTRRTPSTAAITTGCARPLRDRVHDRRRSGHHRARWPRGQVRP